MTGIEEKIIRVYLDMIKKLSISGKQELLKKIVASLESETQNSEENFYKSFGAFGSNKSAGEIIKDIKESRRFKSIDLKL